MTEQTGQEEAMEKGGWKILVKIKICGKVNRTVGAGEEVYWEEEGGAIEGRG